MLTPSLFYMSEGFSAVRSLLPLPFSLSSIPPPLAYPLRSDAALATSPPPSAEARGRAAAVASVTRPLHSLTHIHTSHCIPSPPHNSQNTMRPLFLLLL